jgi:tetratricopeptide (TPR) repeat protein
MIYFFIGEVFSKMKDNVKANEAYKKSVQAKNSKQGMYELRYFQAASLKKLGELDKANEIFNAIIEHAKDQRKAGLEITLIAVEENSVTTNKALSDSYYLEALGNNGLGNHSHATKLYKMALSEYQNNLWAKILMDY